jgi:hypothetical protein
MINETLTRIAANYIPGAYDSDEFTRFNKSLLENPKKIDVLCAIYLGAVMARAEKIRTSKA